jgi:hypothetical protein
VILNGIKIYLDKNIDDTIIIYCTPVQYCLSPYNFSYYISDSIKLKSFCKYITIIINDLCDYDYNIINESFNIKVDNIDVVFKCKISNKNLDLIYLSINNKPTNYIVGKQCKSCKQYNNFKKMLTFEKLIKNNKDKYDENLNQIMPNILDCNDHFNHNENVFYCIKDRYINVYDILEKLNIKTNNKLFKIRNNFVY